MYSFFDSIKPFILSIVIIFLCSSVKAQQSTDEVNLKKPNLKLFEHIVKVRIDSIRKESGLIPFVNDTILYLSSRNHAKYLTKTQNLSHYQSGSRSKRTYHERAVKYGAEDYYVSENLAKVNIIKSNKGDVCINYTYEELAGQVISDWETSLSSMINIVTPSHVIIGVASWLDEENAEIRLAASFAAVTRDYKAKHYDAYFPYADENLVLGYRNLIPETKPPRKYDWGLGAKPNKEALENYRRISRMVNTLELLHRNDSVFVVFTNPRIIEKLFEDSNDGLCLEVVSKNSYPCGTNMNDYIREEEEYTIKGELLMPLYRNYFLTGINDSKKKPKVWVKFLSKVPQNYLSVPHKVNLVIIKSKRIVDIITFNEAPAQIKDLALRFTPANDSLPVPGYFIPHLRRDTLKLRVYFDQNKSEVIDAIGDSIENWVRDKELQRAAVYAYASIEGTDVINRDLTNRRANEMMSYFDTREGSKVPTVRVTMENWFSFFNDIRNSKHDFLRNMDTAQVRNYVNQKLQSRELEPILARHRYADLKILAYKIVSDVNIDELAMAEYNFLFDDLKRQFISDPNSFNISLPVKQRFELVQLYLLHRVTEFRVKWSDVDRLPISIFSDRTFDVASEPLAQLYYNKLRFKLTNQGHTFSHRDSLLVLRELNRFPFPDPAVIYNYLITLLNDKENDSFEPYYRRSKLNEINTLIMRLEGTDIERETIERFKLYYHFLNAESDLYVNKLGRMSKEVKESLDFIYNYLTKYPPAEKSAVELSQFFAAFHWYEEAMQIIEPYAFGEKNSKEIFIAYLKYFYANPRVKQNTDFYQFLKDAADLLDEHEWCNLFEGEWPVNFQVLDHEPLRLLYCKICRN
ncbi:MAG TPA: hypothetical protein PL017_02400 [Tenuifilaceae bacterium]|nr:hypothetical protein [Tenuifilaceae bacterium]HPE17957.1 hypothetical protein [Tenuifilaceae bacterium]HPJ44921.1 hypothetical protein [Tenuifilaceae bacterium]HPQ33113.1 hypothetical protein [Tenuifilaceae bacterium]HRX67045.1 hypothetical protein [Tenuifilaceae bacterium]